MTTDAQAETAYVDGRSTAGELRSRQTRENIKRAALRLWMDQGLDATTIEEICAAAGVGRTTFYIHFSSTEQLLAELAWSTTAGALKDLERIDDDESLRERLDIFVSAAAKRVERLPKHLAIHIIKAAIAGPPETKQLSQGRPAFSAILAREFRTAQAHGELVQDADPDELGAMLEALMMDAILKWANGKIPKASLRAVIRKRLDVVLDGVLRPSRSR